MVIPKMMLHRSKDALYALILHALAMHYQRWSFKAFCAALLAYSPLSILAYMNNAAKKP
jgi:hypothetical protein